jgi:gluconate 2-dehydrogenase alpha chain
VAVVGSGPGGAAAAEVLAAAGWSVIVLERGRNLLVDTDPPYAPRARFSNDELKQQFRHYLGPDPLLEPKTFRRRASDGPRLFTGDVNNMPAMVGGAGPHADGKLPRLREVDFRLRSELGPVDGASVEDWPLEYADLEPYYARAERDVGTAGDHTANPYAAWRSGPYPMPPGPDMYGAVLSARAATTLGLHPYRAPTGVNSRPYDGRPACNNCGFCMHACPIHAKGDPLALLQHALRTGRCQIRSEHVVTEIVTDRTGRRARGVRYVDADTGAPGELSAGHVVVAGGAFETPRLLLRSDRRGDGAGLANSSGLVGRYLMFHFQTYVIGTFPFRIHGHRGRSVSHLMDDFIVPGADDLAAARAVGLPWFRGGTVEHGAAGLPIQEAIHYPSGPAHTQLMAQSPMRDRAWVFTMQGEDLPQATNTVDLDPAVRDVWGLAAGRVTYSPHRHEVAAAERWAPTLEAVLRAMGAATTFWVTSPHAGVGSFAERAGVESAIPISRHWMGTCRMGDDPATSVVDRWSRFHDLDNVICADSSVFVTSAGYNPTLTLVALAMRAAAHLAGTELPATSPSRRAPPTPRFG